MSIFFNTWNEYFFFTHFIFTHEIHLYFIIWKRSKQKVCIKYCICFFSWIQNKVLLLIIIWVMEVSINEFYMPVTLKMEKVTKQKGSRKVALCQQNLSQDWSVAGGQVPHAQSNPQHQTHGSGTPSASEIPVSLPLQGFQAPEPPMILRQNPTQPISTQNYYNVERDAAAELLTRPFIFSWRRERECVREWEYVSVCSGVCVWGGEYNIYIMDRIYSGLWK